jgi:hypothetical protein
MQQPGKKHKGVLGVKSCALIPDFFPYIYLFAGFHILKNGFITGPQAHYFNKDNH